MSRKLIESESTIFELTVPTDLEKKIEEEIMKMAKKLDTEIEVDGELINEE